jgi:hypothetical protein
MKIEMNSVQKISTIIFLVFVCVGVSILGMLTYKGYKKNQRKENDYKVRSYWLEGEAARVESRFKFVIREEHHPIGSFIVWKDTKTGEVYIIYEDKIRGYIFELRGSK